MSSYIIHIEHREEQDVAWVEINDRSSESRTARRCRFQAIGWILEIVDTVNSKVDPKIVDHDYAVKALVDIGWMDNESAQALILAPDWRRRFEIVWGNLNDEERRQALNYDYDYWDNFWPGFDSYNRVMFEIFCPVKEEAPAAVITKVGAVPLDIRSLEETCGF